MTSDTDAGARSLADEISAAIERAEDTALMSVARGDDVSARIISDKLAPALMEARTYAEINLFSAPEIRLGISEATVAASELADRDSEFGSLLSMMQILRERAEKVIRPK